MRWPLAAALRLALLPAVLLPGCLFDPDRSIDRDDDDDDDPVSMTEGGAGGGGGAPGGGDQGDPMCTELEDPCEVNGDCPCFDGTTEVGAGLCLSTEEGGVCTGVCHTNGDCESGCCAELVDVTEYGACAPASQCEGGGTTSAPSETCIAGVTFFCTCADWADVPCSEDERSTFLSSCDSADSSLYDVFECWGGYASDDLDACGAALDDCQVE